MERLYKATDSNSTCRGYQYIPGKLHIMKTSSVELCSQGFHACRKLKDVLQYYSSPEEIWEVEGNVVFEKDDKVVCDQIRLVRLITDEALTTLAKDMKWSIRLTIAVNANTPSKALTVLAKDRDWYIREAVARNISTPSEALSMLAEDENWHVREAVARNTNTSPEVFTTLAKDENKNVRVAVAWNRQCTTGKQ